MTSQAQAADCHSMRTLSTALEALKDCASLTEACDPHYIIRLLETYITLVHTATHV